MDLLNTLVDKGLRRELPTRDKAKADAVYAYESLLPLLLSSQDKTDRHLFQWLRAPDPG